MFWDHERDGCSVALGDMFDFNCLFLLVLFTGLPEASIHRHQLARNDIDNPDGTHHLHFHASQQWPFFPHHQLPSASLYQCQPQHGHQCQRNSAENHWNQCSGVRRANADTYRLHPHARSVTSCQLRSFQFLLWACQGSTFIACKATTGM